MPDPYVGIMINYHEELRDQENNIHPESIIAIDGRNTSKLSPEEIQAVSQIK